MNQNRANLDPAAFYLRPIESFNLKVESITQLELRPMFVLELYTSSGKFWVRNFYSGIYHKFAGHECLQLSSGKLAVPAMRKLLEDRRFKRMTEWKISPN